jgi:hypothetical protein
VRVDGVDRGAVETGGCEMQTHFLNCIKSVINSPE